MQMSNVQAWMKAIRPLTLCASVMPILVAHLFLQHAYGVLEMRWTLMALCSAVLIQIGTNLYNDVVDFSTGADSVTRIGPRRLIQNGIATSKHVAGVAHGAFFCAVLFGIPLVLHAGWPILVLGVLSIVMGYGYSAPPLKLAYRGLSEIFVILFFGVGAVGGIEWLYRQTLSTEAMLLGLTLGLLSTNLLIVNNVRDAETDRRVLKLTLPARFGAVFGRIEFLVCVIAALVSSSVFWSRVHTSGHWTVLAFFPLVGVYTLLTKVPQPHCALSITALSHLLYGLISVGVFLWM